MSGVPDEQLGETLVGGGPLDPMLGKTLGKTRIERKLGEGGMGAVYLARHQTLGSEVAVKVLPPELARQPGWPERFLREARVAARLDHPNAVRVHDVDVEDGVHYLVMDLVRGGSLGELLEREGPRPWQQAVVEIKQAAAALEAAHALGIMHRDIKPDNLMRDEHGAIKVTDFGLARDVGDNTLSATGQISGSPAYMSPEQAESGALGPATDVYSLGVTLHALIAGESPFKRPTLMASLRATFEETLPPLPDVPAALDALLAAMTAKAPAERPSLTVVAAQLEALAGGGGRERGGDRQRSSARGRREAPPTPPAQQSLAVVLLIGAVIVALGVVVAALLISDPGGGSPPVASSSPASEASQPATSASVSSASAASSPSAAALREALAALERTTDGGRRPLDGRAALARAISLAPSDPRVIAWRARLLTADGDPEQAEGLLAAALRRAKGAARVPLLIAHGELLRETKRHDEALTAYRAAIELARGDAEARYGLALTLAQRTRWDEAERELAELLQLAPSARAHLLQANALARRKGQTERALEACRAALALRPGDLEARTLEIRLLASLLRWDEVKRRGNAAEAEGLKLRGVSAAMGDAHRHLGLIDEAIRYYTIAMGEWDSWLLYYNRGTLNLKQGKTAEAFADAKAAVTRAPRQKLTQFLLGNCRLEQGQLGQAEAAFSEAIRIDDRYSDAYAQRAIVRDKLGKTAEAAADRERAAALGNLVALCNRAVLLSRQGKYDEALGLLRGASRRGARAALYWGIKGDVTFSRANTRSGAERRRELESALNGYNLAIRLNRPKAGYQWTINLPNSHVQRAQVRWALGQSREALIDLRAALALDRDHRPALVYLARYARLANRLAESELACRKLIDRRPPDMLGYSARASLRLTQGRLDEALADARRAVELGPNSPILARELGGIALLAGDTKLARAQLARAVQLRDPIAALISYGAGGERAVLERVSASRVPLALIRFAQGELTRAQLLAMAGDWDGGPARMRGWLGMLSERAKPGSGRADLEACAAAGRTTWIGCWAAHTLRGN